MRKNAARLFALILFFPASSAFADIASIHSDRLPQETAVLAALDDAKLLEPYSQSWTHDWKYPIAKEDVATRLGKDLGFLTLALKDHPDNVELLLLTGLVARYAYNLDVEGSHDIAINALDKAQKLAISDVRALWFRATLQCQTNEMKDGADGFLTIEASHVWNQLPAAFWEDYIKCATIANMPVHTLRAIGYLGKLHTPNPTGFDSALNIAHDRIVPFDPKKEYDTKEVWYSAEAGKDWNYTCTTCGLRFRARGDWTIDRLDVTKGSGVVIIGMGPYQATVHKLHPSILVLIQQPKGNETLTEYSKKFLTDGTFEPFIPVRCPTSFCIAMKGVQPRGYDKDGDGHSRVVVFERDQPEFPGLIFESPMEIPKSEGGVGVTYYRPSKTQQRIPGKLYYLVLLDTAASIEEPAMKDFDFFLQNLTVE